MYYNAEEVETTLRCSFCKEKFEDVVKFVPECGCFICGKCHIDLQDDATETGQYKCETCLETHSIPENGLPDCKQLLPLLKSRPLEKPLSANAIKLKAMLKEVSEQVEIVTAFDVNECINEHCDRLEQEVKETVSSAIEHLSKIEADLLKEINEYRNQCLSKADTLARYKTTQELEKMSLEINELTAKWNHYFTRLDVLISEADVEANLDVVERFKTQMESLDRERREEALDRKMLVFKPNLTLFQSSETIGAIVNLAPREFPIKTTTSCTLSGHSSKIFAVLHLSSDRMASCSEDKTIRVWDLKERRELFKLEGHSRHVYSLATLPNGQLVSGSGDFTVKVWNLEQRKKIRTLRGHTASVLSICALKNGNLASCSNDNTIKIWNPNLSENNLLLTFTGHEEFRWLISIGLLLNGSLVTCSRDKEDKEEAVLRVWHPLNGELIKEVPTGFRAARSLLSLKGDRVAIGFNAGSIKVVDLINEAASVIKLQAHESSIFALAQLSNGNLISHGKDDTKLTIKFWKIPEFSLLQTINFKNMGFIFSLSISPDENCLVSAGEDSTIKLLPITN